MNWLNVDRFYFPQHAAILEVGRVDSINFHDVCCCIKAYRDSTNIVECERAVRSLITRVRPGLAGCCLWGISFDQMQQLWQIVVEHPSLPMVDAGAELQRIPLIPQNTPVAV